jgi:hypothetical protein
MLKTNQEEKDKAAARQFLNCCYDDTLRMPAKDKMQRLVELGWVERLDNGAYAETPILRNQVLY